MPPAIMKAFGLVLIIVTLLLTLVDPVVALDHGVRGGHFVRQDTTDLPSRTDTSPPSTATATVLFNTMGELTTCMPFTVTWTAGGPNIPMTITIVDAGVIQSAPPPSSPSTTKSGTNTLSNLATGAGVRDRAVGDGDVMVSLARSVDSSSRSFTWSSVNVSEGWYQLIAQADDRRVLAVSQHIFARNGTDTSCLGGSPPSSTQSSPTSVSQPTGTNTDSSTTGATQSKQLNVGAVVGGVVGGVAFLALLALACGCVWKRRKSRASAAMGDGGDKNGANGGARTGVIPFGKWGKLGSGSFNDKDRSPTAGHADATTDGNRVSAMSTGRPRSHSASGGGFLAGVLKTSAAPSPKKPPAPPSSKKKQYRHNSHSESIGGMLSSSATTSMTGSSAFHGTDDDHLYSYERHVPMSPISAGGSSAASSVRNPPNVGAVRSPFSDPSDNDSDSVVYGLYGTTRNPNMGVIPIGYDRSTTASNAPTPSPVPSSCMYDSSTVAVAGHSSDSNPPSRRNSRGHPDRLYPYASQQERMRAHTLLGGMYTHPNSQQQTLPETPRNDSLLTFSSSSSTGGGSKQGKNTRSKSLHESTISSSELYDLSARSSTQTPSLITPTAVQASPSIQSVSGATFGANATKRTTRKPVPSYSPDDFPGASVAGGSSSASSSPASSPTMYSPLTAPDGVVSDGQREVFRQHELLHKDSMGSMKGASKMHVLIPDMPPPQRH